MLTSALPSDCTKVPKITWVYEIVLLPAHCLKLKKGVLKEMIWSSSRRGRLGVSGFTKKKWIATLYHSRTWTSHWWDVTLDEAWGLFPPFNMIIITPQRDKPLLLDSVYSKPSQAETPPWQECEQGIRALPEFPCLFQKVSDVFRSCNEIFSLTRTDVDILKEGFMKRKKSGRVWPSCRDLQKWP